MESEAALFKALSDPTRLRLAALLAMRGETCVCALAGALGQPAFKISRHLGILRAAGMVRARRQGTWMHYRLVKPRGKLEACLQECFRGCLRGHPVVRADLRRLQNAAHGAGTCP